MQFIEAQGADNDDLAVVIVAVGVEPSVRPVLAACIRMILSASTQALSTRHSSSRVPGRPPPARRPGRSETFTVALGFCRVG
jgi:hypothetical protein